MNLKKIFTDKKYGFYVSLAVTALSLITGIVYFACYAGTRDFNLGAGIAILLGFVLSLVLILFNKVSLVNYVLGICALAGLLFYIEGVYLYVSEVMVGIDETEFSPQFLVTVIFFVITFITALVNCFLPQVKKPQLANEEENKEVTNE